MADDRNSETPLVSRSGRVVKKSAKVREMEDFDINELDMQGKSRKKSKNMDDFDEFDDKRVAPIKIPKISLNMQGGVKKMASPPINRQLFKNVYHQGSMKGKPGHTIYNDSSDGSKESDSSSVSSESSSSGSSSDNSDNEDPFPSDARYDRKTGIQQGLSVHRDKVIVEPQQVTSYEPPASYMEQSSDMSSDDSEDAASDPALVIAEDSDESTYTARGKKGGAIKRAPPAKKDPNYAPRQANRRKPAAKAPAKQKKTPGKTKALSAYQLWCNENRKRICAYQPNISFGNLGKKMGEAWQAVPEKEKMAWKRKAKRLALQNTSNIINTGPAAPGSPTKVPNRGIVTTNEDILKGLAEITGTLGNAPIDVAAHLKLLGDSLTVIGQRLIEHEGQLAVSGIYSVLLDTLLCAIGPLLCLTSEITGLEKVPTETFQKTLDHIAYFMPGL